MTNFKSLFLLDPDVIYLNHGSFGACPAPVFEQYQRWQRELELQPVEFLGRQSTHLLAQSRAALGAYIGADADELIYFPNPTTALNMVARNVPLAPGDEILTTDHEYGALDRTWRFLSKNNGASIIRHAIQLPINSESEFVEDFWAAVTPKTRVIFISHLTSPTALIFPIAEICKRARERGILTIIDGAHVPGQLPLNLHELGCDIYSGACHKWMCSAKGAAFIYARPEIQQWLNPLVVSWGWGDENIDPSPNMGDTRFIRFHEWQGTRDIAAYLTVPTAIEFLHEHHWENIQRDCHSLALATRDRINTLTGLEPLSTEQFFGQLVAARLPASADVAVLKTRLYNEYHIEVPLHVFNGMNLIRISFQAYNTQAEADALVETLGKLL
jgi:isopenicillin-N epimerase